jgi:CheY-like chemotaxis protein
MEVRLRTDEGAARWQQHQATFGTDAPPGRRRALVVDDDRDTRETIAILLTWAGHDVQQAADGYEALRLAEQFRPDVVFLDIGMPRLNGYEVCRRLRQTTALRHARIFALSGISGTVHDALCDEAGFSARLTKPVDPAALMRLG